MPQPLLPTNLPGPAERGIPLGTTEGNLGGSSFGDRDAFLAKYDSLGNLAWTQQWGTAEREFVTGLSTDLAGKVYVSGYTTGDLAGLSSGLLDGFVTEFDEAGNLKWNSQFGSDTSDQATSIFADGFGSLYISGSTLGSLGGPNLGSWDAFLMKLNVVPEPSSLLLLMFGAIGLMPPCGRRFASY